MIIQWQDFERHSTVSLMIHGNQDFVNLKVIMTYNSFSVEK